MPYIDQERRKAIFGESIIDYNSDIGTAGELNYFLTCILKEYVDRKGLNYQTINDISGAMTECLAEFRRRIVAPYEDSKIKSNGDVYLKLLEDLKKTSKT